MNALQCNMMAKRIRLINSLKITPNDYNEYLSFPMFNLFNFSNLLLQPLGGTEV